VRLKEAHLIDFRFSTLFKMKEMSSGVRWTPNSDNYNFDSAYQFLFFVIPNLDSNLVKKNKNLYIIHIFSYCKTFNCSRIS